MTVSAAQVATYITYLSGASIYRDNNNDDLINIGDTRQTFVRSLQPRTFAGPLWPFNAADAAWYVPGSTVANEDPDEIGAGHLLNFAAYEYYYDQFNDGAYLGSDYVAVGGVSNNGVASGFPVPHDAAATSSISFTVPANAAVGSHAVFITTDEPPTPATGAPLGLMGTTIGWQAGTDMPNIPPWLGVVPGFSLPFESLTWSPSIWPTSAFGTEAE